MSATSDYNKMVKIVRLQEDKSTGPLAELPAAALAQLANNVPVSQADDRLERAEQQDQDMYGPVKGSDRRQATALESIAESLKRLADKLAPIPKRPAIIPEGDVLKPRRPSP